MIAVTVDRKEYSAAGLVASHVHLSSVYLSRATVVNDLPDEGFEHLSVEVSHSCLGHRVVGTHLVVEVGVKVSFSGPKESETSEKRDLATIDVVYGARYSLPKGDPPEQVKNEGFPAFARLNGLHSLWPYLRDEVNRLSAAMGLTLLLPVLRIVTKEEEKQEEPKKATKKKSAIKKRPTVH